MTDIPSKNSGTRAPRTGLTALMRLLEVGGAPLKWPAAGRTSISSIAKQLEIKVATRKLKDSENITIYRTE